MKQLYGFFCTKLTIFAYIKDHKMRYITVEDVIHTGIQTQITPDVQTHCCTNKCFFFYRILYHIDLHPAFKLWLLLLPIPYIADFQI